jgi:hypothetical protein
MAGPQAAVLTLGRKGFLPGGLHLAKARPIKRDLCLEISLMVSASWCIERALREKPKLPNEQPGFDHRNLPCGTSPALLRCSPGAVASSQRPIPRDIGLEE